MHVRHRLGTSERRTYREAGVARSTQHHKSQLRNDDDLRSALIRLAKQYGRYGYRKIGGLLAIEDWRVNHKKIERLWREEGLQLPNRHKKRNVFIIMTRRSSGSGQSMQTTSGQLTSRTTS